MVAPSTLQKAMQHYYALGHIHIRQEVFMNGIYSGSIYNKNWGETEQKSFEVIEITQYPDKSDPTFELYKQTIPLTSARPMIKLEAEFDAKLGFITKADFKDEDNYDNPVNSEIRYRVTVNENDRKLITEEKINELEKFFKSDGNEIKIEFNIIPVERESRSEQIMHCKTLIDEVKEYATVTEQPINGTIETKVLQMQEKGVGL
jgi:DNA repair exonuclease SbcCD nuclease subunit